MAENEIDLVPEVVEIMDSLYAELRERFPGVTELSKRDREAIRTAIVRAAWRGMLHGAARLTVTLNAQLAEMNPEDPITIEPNFAFNGIDGLGPDPWAKEYGED